MTTKATSLAEAREAYRKSAVFLTEHTWRPGHQNPCNVYADLGTADYHDDHPIGCFVTPELAAEACAAHNGRLRRPLPQGLRALGSPREPPLAALRQR